MKSRRLIEGEEEKYPDYVKGITFCTVESFNSLVTIGLIKGCNLKKTVEIIREAMMVKATFGFKYPEAPFVCEVLFGPDFDLNEGDK